MSEAGDLSHSQLAAMVEAGQPEVLAARGAALERAAEAFGSVRPVLDRALQHAEWQGEGAEAFRAYGQRLGGDVDRLALYARTVGRALQDAGEALRSAQTSMPPPAAPLAPGVPNVTEDARLRQEALAVVERLNAHYWHSAHLMAGADEPDFSSFPGTVAGPGAPPPGGPGSPASAPGGAAVPHGQAVAAPHPGPAQAAGGAPAFAGPVTAAGSPVPGEAAAGPQQPLGPPSAAAGGGPAPDHLVRTSLDALPGGTAPPGPAGPAAHATVSSAVPGGAAAPSAVPGAAAPPLSARPPQSGVPGGAPAGLTGGRDAGGRPPGPPGAAPRGAVPGAGAAGGGRPPVQSPAAGRPAGGAGRPPAAAGPSAPVGRPPVAGGPAAASSPGGRVGPAPQRGLVGGTPVAPRQVPGGTRLPQQGVIGAPGSSAPRPSDRGGPGADGRSGTGKAYGGQPIGLPGGPPRSPHRAAGSPSPGPAHIIGGRAEEQRKSRPGRLPRIPVIGARPRDPAGPED
ncbi:hypothetical protein PJ985_19380 [Streptomyces sp. ACA25]|uniref:hypothetical protein n=1 Tax=Streptomyces sp. ACA25 TaxID=3022596 RepID=UPI002306FBA4|nr:hypothetical protein [Streptomyces sp. ACA25]MDB1089722.1 hypothetical protein [Streptomyces sp. ACA25]